MPGERAPGTHWIGGWVGSGVWKWRRKKPPCPYREPNPGLSACTLVTIMAELPILLYSWYFNRHNTFYSYIRNYLYQTSFYGVCFLIKQNYLKI